MAVQREWFEKDYYAALGVKPDAAAKEITKAYRKLARQHHPDATGGDDEKFKEISAAYDVLGDEDTRKEYDEARRVGPGAAGFSGGPFTGGPGGFQVNFEDGDMGGFGDLFGGLFGRRGGAGGRGPGIRGVDQEARLHLGFNEAVNGVTTTVHLSSDVPTANGIERRTREVKVRIPAGVDDGQRIRLRGKGGPGRGGGEAGDLYVVIDVQPHEIFGRSGRDLTIAVPITFPEAALGASVKVPTFDDSTVTLKVPAGTRSGKTFRVKGRGVETPKGKGDMLVTVDVVVPQKPTKKEREAIEALAEVTDWSPRDHLEDN
ncbi:MAG: DnaJ domain-containing protein [Actinomycetia bacterium]|nr:DnaJ domain-containing protein [Actinomycetes bacterium]MCP4963356.1 DnaJ domain-containing protein [Actinomycetes bacterium]